MDLNEQTPTIETYNELNRAYEYFNTILFGGVLPDPVITMNRHRHFGGYFLGNSWADVEVETVRDEIALNPDTLRNRPLEDVLSLLVHEMVHLQQHHFGQPSRGNYHNKQWGTMMEGVGLIPSKTGEPGGQRTGQGMSHYIEDGGRFDLACQALLAEGFTIPWLALTTRKESTRKKKAASKTKYSCPACRQNVWGKPDVNVICGECMEVMNMVPGAY